ncbi:MAG: amidohydrolase family protein, partial [Gammaproteobacteria bacterium]
LYEIAIMTRAAPARSLGLTDRGHLGLGAGADITVYKEHKDRERMFSRPQFVFKDGELVVKKGKVIKITHGSTHVARPDYDQGIERILRPHLEKYHTLGWENRTLRDEEIAGEGRGRIVIANCTPRQTA